MQTSPIEKALLAILVIVSIALFLQPLIIRFKAIMSAKGTFDFDRIPDRIARWFREVFFQGTVIAGRPLPGLMHAFVFWAFIVFAFETLDLMTRMFGSPVGIFGDGVFHHFYQGIVAIFAILASIGILYLFIRRFFFRPASLGDHLSWSSGLVAFFILFLMGTYLLGIYSFADKPVEFKINAWLHIIVILAFLVLIPRSKHLHLFLSLITTFLKDFELARIKPLNLDPEADESTWELGAEKLTDLSRKTALDAFTCVECGRCFDQCPARFTGKKLDPKQLMLNLRTAFLAKSETPLLEDEKFNSIIWSCTTCGACTFQCPVGIDQVVPQIEMRRGSVSNGIFPDAMRPLFDNLESVGNPWLYQPSDAAAFIAENNFPEYSKGKILWWMGCMARYDDHYRKVALAFKKLLDAAKVDYGVLVEEQCTGDAARRAGNELLFQTLAGVNIEMLNGADPETIITSCPHCLRTLGEYKDLGLKANVKIIHHTQFLVDLIKDGKLKIERKPNGKVTYHDACYLSRYGEDKDYLNPRELIEKAGGVLFEPARTKRTSFCCGAGGGMLFTEETEGTRINHGRVEELMKTDADTYAIACPFCQMMIRDGFGDKGRENAVVKDVAQILADCIESS